ncbi:MAG: asparaginase [Oscillospiraceae bacterium]|nr:asparaginase [Oscillospiraceae bacterium]
MSKKIAVIFTGGTICCETVQDGTRRPHAETMGYQLLDTYREQHPEQEFSVDMPMNMLSEDFTPFAWNLLLEALRRVAGNEVCGVIIAHGTDSLAETAAMLSVALLGYRLPVILVSAHSPLTDQRTNGHVNFAAAVQLLQQEIPHGVWVVYQNPEDVVYVHQGAHLRACANESDSFFSRDMQPISTFVPPKQKKTHEIASPLFSMSLFSKTDSVLLIRPYIGQRYDRMDLEGIAAIIHGTYHSETANSQYDSPYSVRYLIKEAKKNEIPVFLAPCNAVRQQYGSAADLVEAGAVPLTDASVQLAYGAASVGISLGYRGTALYEWVSVVCELFAD